MTKNQWLEHAASMLKYADLFRSRTNDIGCYKRGLACKAFSLVYSDRAAAGYKVKAA